MSVGCFLLAFAIYEHDFFAAPVLGLVATSSLLLKSPFINHVDCLSITCDVPSLQDVDPALARSLRAMQALSHQASAVHADKTLVCRARSRGWSLWPFMREFSSISEAQSLLL